MLRQFVGFIQGGDPRGRATKTYSTCRIAIRSQFTKGGGVVLRRLLGSSYCTACISNEKQGARRAAHQCSQESQAGRARRRGIHGSFTSVAGQTEERAEPSLARRLPSSLGDVESPPTLFRRVRISKFFFNLPVSNICALAPRLTAIWSVA